MKKLFALLVLGFTVFLAQSAHAIEVIEQPLVLPNAPIIISSTQYSKDEIEFIELYNASNEPVNLDGWKVSLGIDDVETQDVALLSGWMAPKEYILISSTITGADFYFEDHFLRGDKTPQSFFFSSPGTGFANEEIVAWQSIPVGSGGSLPEEVYLNRSSFTATGKLTLQAGAIGGVYAGGVYIFPLFNQLQITEILPVSRDCSPAEIAKDCTDYVKIYNPTDATIILDDFRLRSGYQGQNSTISNTFPLSGEIGPGQYVTLNTRSDGVPISLTNTGGYIWLEDMYGIKFYDNTIVQYPDASAAKNKGASWAYEETSGIWKWGVPSPDSANKFPVEVVGGKGSGSAKTGLVPCRADQYRNPETGRCRLLESSSSTLTPCKAGQERNLETNRCRSTASTASALKPCDPGQERNPETNRCRKIGVSENELKPCAVNQERNPETNRCRKKTVTELAQDIKDVQSPMLASRSGWLIAGAAATAASGYGAWEWRTEIRNGWRRFRSLFGKNPPSG